MKRIWSVAAVAMLVACLPLRAETPTSKILADAAGRANMLAFLTYTYASDLGSRNVGGQALCIDSSGLFITCAVLDASMKAKNVQNASLTLSDGKSVKATFMWVDPETGVGFFRAAEKATFNAAKFATDAKYPVGGQVASVGLNFEDIARTPYVGGAYISAVVHMPDPVVYVINGSLTSVGSPVFDENGLVVGLVGPQPWSRYQAPSQQGGSMDVMLKGQQTSSYFTPASAFVDVLDYLAKTPDLPRQMPWIGALKIEAVDSLRAKDLNTPALVVSKVIPGQAGDRAGLKNDDLIVGLNGQPLPKQPHPALLQVYLQRQILKLGVGKEVTLTVRRGTQDVPVKMTLEPMLTMPADAARWRSENLALIVRERLLVDQYTIDSATVPGVLVEGVYQRGPAETADVQPNDLITTINDQPVQTVGDVKKLVEASVAANPGKAVTLVVRRGAGGDTKSLAIQPVMPQSQPTSAPAR